MQVSIRAKLDSLSKPLKVTIGVILIAGLFIIIYFFQRHSREVAISGIEPLAVSEIEQNIPSITTETTNQSQEATTTKPALAEKFLLDVPFQAQAPYGDWSQPYEDACEEATIIIVKHFLTGESLSKAEMKGEIDDAVLWQEKNWGGHFDLSAEKTLQLAGEYFGLSGQVIRNYQLSDLRSRIASGSPIIVPTAGRMLGNPNFTGAGPEYHMIVIVGYNNSSGVFITNDPGTRKGESYIYKYQTVLDAISGPRLNMERAVIILNK